MTIKSAAIAPPYSIILINDPTNRFVPEWKDGPVVSGTDSCLFISCMAEVDGKTEFTLGNVKEVSPEAHLVFDGIINTPSSKISLETAECDPVIEIPTSGQRTRIWIWANSTSRPDKVIIGIE